MSGPRIALLVTHLMGSGHLVRTLTLARALAGQGAAPLVISGGRPLAHVATGGLRFAQLPPLSSDGLDYRTLLDETGVIRVSDALVESNLRLEESNQSLSDLLGLVGHDLKNPLTVSLGFLSMTGLELDDLAGTGADVSGARAMLGRATEAAHRVESLLASVLEMSRIDYSTLRSRGEPVDVAEVVQQAVTDLTIISEVEIDDLTGLRAVADASHLRQVLGNLLSNADKYGAAPISISGDTVGSTTRIVVSDAGRGVPEDFLPRLFERFSRAERESKPGTGLGLHLARQLCRVMGGDLTYLPPADGEGPRFVVSLAAG